jgi:gluconolactonase
VLWSDIPNNRILKWEEETGAVSVFRRPTNNANGNTRDRQGRLVTCEHDSRRVTRTEYDGSITVLADNYNGKKLNSPNDVVVTRDGAVWFTDPPFGILGYYEGHVDSSEIAPAVYRLDPASGQLSMVTDQVPGPNGLAFSPDEKILYVVASRADPRELHAFDVMDGKKLANGRVFINAAGGTPDGFRVDVDGNLWCGWGMGDPALDGVRIFNAAGAPIGHVRLPERCANLCFGGRYRNRLFMAASHGLYSLYVNTQGVAGG